VNGVQWRLPDDRLGSVEFEENTDWGVRADAFVTRPADPDVLGWHTQMRTRSELGFPCLVCGATEGVDMHHLRHIRKMGTAKPTGFAAVMRALILLR
jgi:hypothetical protein